MGKLSLLKEYLKLALKEATFVGPKQPFKLTTPPVTGKRAYTGDYTIYREFPVSPTPDMMQALGVSETDLDEDGLLWAEHEIGIDVDMYYERPERQTMNYPGNPGGYSIDNWTPVSINGLTLSPQDAKALQDYMGELTDNEQDSLIEQYDDSHQPDFD